MKIRSLFLGLAAVAAVAFAVPSASAHGTHPELSYAALADDAQPAELQMVNPFSVKAAPLPAAIPQIESAPVALPSAPRKTTWRNLLVTAFGSLVLLGTVNARTLRDVNLSKTTVLPAANAANYSASIDTANVNPGRLEGVELIVECPATASLVDAHTVTLTVKDSADNVTFNAVADIPAQVITGAGGVGAAAFAYQCALPIGLRRYVRLDAAVSNGGGDNTAVSYSIGFIF